MADKVHADTAEIIHYAGQLTKIGKGKEAKAPMLVNLGSTQSLNQMSELSLNSFTNPASGDTAGQFQEALLVAGYLADNAASFSKFLPDVANGIQCCAMQAQGVGEILMYTDGGSAGSISAEDVANALAFASGDPNAKRPDGVPKELFKNGTFAEQQSQTLSNQPASVSDPNSQFAETYTEPGAHMTTTTYLDGSMRVVSYYTTTNADGTYTNHTTTTVYDTDGKEIKNGGQTEDTKYGTGYHTTTRHEGNTTVETTVHDDGSVDMKTTTENAKGDPVVTESHTKVDDGAKPSDNGPIENWEKQGHSDGGSQHDRTYAGY
ncbi:hypothetical protein AB0I55_07345 [Actinocatenispora sera]|uniref:hypothetical protein n=1 Tax=Actinocatenispora sera TaxID=390989 RepID=UPI0033FC6A07